MNKGIATELQDFCDTIAERYSNVNRVGNVSNESFTVEEIIPTSDHSACVNFCNSLINICVCHNLTSAKDGSQKICTFDTQILGG